MKRLIKRIEELGWTVNTVSLGKDNRVELEIGRYSPAGRDFSFSVNALNSEELIKDIKDYYQSFDISRETYMWLDSDGHGTNGAPYYMADVLKDTKEICIMLYELKKSVSEFTDEKDIISFLEKMVRSRKTIPEIEDMLKERFMIDVKIENATEDNYAKDDDIKDGLADYNLMFNIDTEEIFLDGDIYVLPTREKRDDEIVYYITEVGYEF